MVFVKFRNSLDEKKGVPTVCMYFSLISWT